MQFALIALLAGYSAVFAVHAAWFRAMFFMVGLSFGVVSAAYFFRKPSWLLNRPNGSRSFLAWLLLWPYYLLARASLAAYRISQRQAVPVAEVVPGLWFSRWLTSRELQRISPSAVLDLAAELPHCGFDVPTYRSLPWLDGRTPSQEDLRRASVWISEHLERGPVLVHCALGHGRTGSAILAWLADTGQMSNTGDAVQRLRALRPTFSVSKAQLIQIERLKASRAAG